MEFSRADDIDNDCANLKTPVTDETDDDVSVNTEFVNEILCYHNLEVARLL